MNARATISGVMLTTVLGLIAYANNRSQAEDPPAASQTPEATGKQSAVTPKPLSANTKRGLAYLVDQQHADGGWGQGGGWRIASQNGGRVEGAEVNDPSDLGNTCIATLALIRAGHTPTQGEYANRVARAVALICGYIERSDNDSLYATDVRDTQLQSKIGQYVDTFLAGLVLSELKGQMPADGSDKRLLAALDKTVRKIEKNQGADGNFAGNHGWASVLSQSVNSKFINRAAQKGVAVKAEVLDRDFRGSLAALDLKSGTFVASAPVSTGAFGSPAVEIAGPTSTLAGGAGTVKEAATVPSDAGVQLYYAASNASRISDQGNTTAVFEQRAKLVLSSKESSADEKEQARQDLKRAAEVREAQATAVHAIVDRLGDEKFIAGFGNNGGEEFLSYMNIAEMLVVKGGNEWEKWSESMAANLGRVQNQDGSWSGQHCITGRTFCTAAALLTLMADRAPVPAVAQVDNQPMD